MTWIVVVLKRKLWVISCLIDSQHKENVDNANNSAGRSKENTFMPEQHATCLG